MKEEQKLNEPHKPKLDIFGVTNRTFKCNRCGTIYTLIDGDIAGCCVMPVVHRTSGICGGELIEVI